MALGRNDSFYTVYGKRAHMKRLSEILGRLVQYGFVAAAIAMVIAGEPWFV